MVETYYDKKLSEAIRYSLIGFIFGGIGTIISLYLIGFL